MKKALLFMLCFFSVSAFAQDGFFLQPNAGLGIGSIKFDTKANTYPINSVQAYDMELNAGYEFRRFLFISGVGYLRTGFNTTAVESSQGAGNNTTSGNGSITVYYSYSLNTFYNHLLIPISAGYKFIAGKRFSVSSIVGVEMAYNYSAAKVDNTTPKAKETMPADQFKYYYNQLSTFGIVQLNFDYKIAHNLSLICAPKADYMLTNIVKDQRIPATQHNYAFLLNAGIKWQLTKNKAKHTTEENQQHLK